MFYGRTNRRSSRQRREAAAAQALIDNVPRFTSRQKVEVNVLEHFLKTNFPRDLLMPVSTGTKKPAYCHRGSAWSWGEYSQCVKTDTICILLRDLVVIDVDDIKQASKLEETFPILLIVPTVKTTRGKHYYFKRTVACDEEVSFSFKKLSM